jgi:hypothetical protein
LVAFHLGEAADLLLILETIWISPVTNHLSACLLVRSVQNYVERDFLLYGVKFLVLRMVCYNIINTVFKMINSSSSSGLVIWMCYGKRKKKKEKRKKRKRRASSDSILLGQLITAISGDCGGATKPVQASGNWKGE